MTDAEYRIDPEEAVAAAIDAAEEIDDSVADEVPEKPRLLVDKSNPHQTVATLRDILAEAGGLYDRGVPVRLAVDQTQKGTVAQMMTRSGVVLRAHQVCRPYALKKGDEVDVGLPSWFALMYLEWWGEWQLPALNGIASAPLLQDDGTINTTEGYDPASGMWCENVPDLTGRVPEQPTRDEAEAALQLIRRTFRTFCFADAETLDDPSGVAVVDTSKAPGRDEFFFSGGIVDGCLSAESPLGARCVAAGCSNVGGRCREGSARPLHVHHRLWARSACCDRRRDSGRTGETGCRRANGWQPSSVPRQSQQHRFSVGPPCERNHGTSGACQAAWQITDGAVELICLRDHDW